MHATVHLDTHHHAGPIDRRLFGGFVEHMGRCVYTGIFDPGNPLSDGRGFRRDVLDVLRRLDLPVVRYPGGNFVSAYDWQDGVGPVADRPRRPDFAWSSVESNAFGTDEFMAWAEELGTAPMMAVNLGTAGAKEAGELLEYCNLPTGTSFADRRAANGHPEPYGVKLWCLGNEMDGPWQAGHVPAEEYALRARSASVLMKGLDPTIETVACGSSGTWVDTYLEYDRVTLETCWDTVDFISAHRYCGNPDGDPDAFLAEGVGVDRMIADYAGLLDYVRGRKRSEKKVHVSFDEWNVWYRHATEEPEKWQEAPALAEEAYNLEDALVCAQYLSAFVRRADVVKMACVAQLVNVIAPVMTRPDGVLVHTTFFPMELFSRHARGVSLRVAVDTPDYAAGKRGDTPQLDASASFEAETGEAAVFLVNRHRGAALDTRVTFSDRRVVEVLGVTHLGGGDVKAGNTWDDPEAVTPAAGEARVDDDGQGVSVTVRAPGFAVLRLATEPR